LIKKIILKNSNKNNNLFECKTEDIDYNDINDNDSVIHPDNNIIINDKQISNNKKNNFFMNIKTYLINDSIYKPKNTKRFEHNILYPQKNIIDINIRGGYNLFIYIYKKISGLKISLYWVA